MLVGTRVLARRLGRRMAHRRGRSRFRPDLATGAGIIVGLGASAFPASAQTFDEAVWANTSLALQLCVSGQVAPETRAGWFRAAGFSESVDRSQVNSDTTHTFTAPADTVRVELYYGEMPEHCSVETSHLDATRASALLDAVIPGLFPGYTRILKTGPVNPVTGQPASCVSYEDPTSPIGHVVGVIAAQQDNNACIDNGTALFYSSFRV